MRPYNLLDFIGLGGLELLGEVPDPDSNPGSDFFRIENQISEFRFFAATSGDASVDVQSRFLAQAV